MIDMHEAADNWLQRAEDFERKARLPAMALDAVVTLKSKAALCREHAADARRLARRGRRS